MNIVKTQEYTIVLKEEHSDRDNHTILGKNIFTFTGLELLSAIVYMGMSPGKVASLSRKKEVEFKIAMVEHVLKEVDKKVGKNTYKYLVLDEKNFSTFDASEKKAIDYWLGMFIGTLIIRKVYKYDYAVHFSRYYKGKSSAATFTFNKSTIKDTSKSAPDILGLICPNTYGLFEAKGYLNYKEIAMGNAYDQVKRFKTMNHIPFNHNLVIYSVLGNPDKIEAIYKDPEGEDDVAFDINEALFWQYKPIIDLLNENGYQIDKKNKDFETIVFEDGKELSFYINKNLYEKYKNAEEYLKADNASIKIREDFGDIFKESGLIRIE